MCKEEKKVIEDIIMDEVPLDELVYKSMMNSDFFKALSIEYKIQVKTAIKDRGGFMPSWINQLD